MTQGHRDLQTRAGQLAVPVFHTGPSFGRKPCQLTARPATKHPGSRPWQAERCQCELCLLGAVFAVVPGWETRGKGAGTLAHGC